MRHVIDGVDVLVDIDSVLVSAIAEGVVLVKGLDGVFASRAVGSMALEGVHHVVLVVLKTAHDGLKHLDRSRHGCGWMRVRSRDVGMQVVYGLLEHAGLDDNVVNGRG